MREVVIHGIVEVMNDRQLADRGTSLHDALARMKERRGERSEPTPANLTFGVRTEPVLDEPRRRNGLFRFGDRGRDALDGVDES